MQSSKLNHFYFWRMLWGSLYHAEWGAAAAKDGIWGRIGEFGRALIGFSSWPFFVPRTAGWTPDTLDELLAERGIVTWGWGATGHDFIFHVKQRQSHWAQYLLLEAGVPLHGRQLNGNGYTSRRRRTTPNRFQAPRGGYRPTRGTFTVPARVSQPEPVAATPGTPMAHQVGHINQLVNHLAD